jgi:hypothetical protein
VTKNPTHRRTIRAAPKAKLPPPPVPSLPAEDGIAAAIAGIATRRKARTAAREALLASPLPALPTPAELGYRFKPRHLHVVSQAASAPEPRCLPGLHRPGRGATAGQARRIAPADGCPVTRSARLRSAFLIAIDPLDLEHSFRQVTRRTGCARCGGQRDARGRKGGLLALCSACIHLVKLYRVYGAEEAQRVRAL